MAELGLLGAGERGTLANERGSRGTGWVIALLGVLRRYGTGERPRGTLVVPIGETDMSADALWNPVAGVIDKGERGETIAACVVVVVG
jgi:hypothetical protein